MQVTNHSNNKRNMKEELLEAIYGTVERLEQKVAEEAKKAEAETMLKKLMADGMSAEEILAKLK